MGAAARTVVRTHGLGRQPGELCVGIPALGARGRPVARSHGLMVWGGSLSSTWGFLHLEEPEGGQSDGRTE